MLTNSSHAKRILGFDLTTQLFLQFKESKFESNFPQTGLICSSFSSTAHFHFLNESRFLPADLPSQVKPLIRFKTEIKSDDE